MLKYIFLPRKKNWKCFLKKSSWKLSKIYSRAITPRVRMSGINYFLNTSNNTCLWHRERHEQIHLNKEQMMTSRSVLNYRPWRLGTLASFQLESNLCNASQVNLHLCHNSESPDYRKAQVILSQATLNKLKWSKIYWKSQKTFWQRMFPHNLEIGALTKEIATGSYLPVLKVELVNCQQVERGS